MTQMNLSLKQIHSQRTDLWSPRGNGAGEWMEREFGANRCKLSHIGWINNKVLLYSMGNYIQHPGIKTQRKRI